MDRNAKPLPPPTLAEREAARASAALIRAALVDPALAGERIVAHVDLAQPRRGVTVVMWPGLPGLSKWSGMFHHDLLPGWEYTPAEFKGEMLDDLDRLAETGERPAVATR